MTKGTAQGLGAEVTMSRGSDWGGEVGPSIFLRHLVTRRVDDHVGFYHQHLLLIRGLRSIAFDGSTELFCRSGRRDHQSAAGLIPNEAAYHFERKAVARSQTTRARLRVPPH